MNRILKYIISAAVAVAALTACSFDKVVPEYPTKKVLFTYQQYNRQVVVGEGLGIEVGFVFAGLPASDRDRVVKFEIDPTLITNEKQSLLPADYYTLAQEGQTVIKKGSLKSYVPLALDSAAFVNDPKALTGEYILPVRITEADADEISEGKDYTLISLSYQGRQYGNYTYFGTATSSTVEEGKKYMNQSSTTASVRQLQTIGPNRFRVYADQSSNIDPMKGTYSMIVTVPIDGGGEIELEPDTEYLPAIQIEKDGICTYDVASKTFVLRYRYTDKDGNIWHAEDKMTFRNRIRDDQGDGRVLYEWRGF